MTNVKRRLYVNSEYEDPELMMVIPHLFHLANEEGILGRKVTGFKFVDDSVMMGTQKKYFEFSFEVPEESK